MGKKKQSTGSVHVQPQEENQKGAECLARVPAAASAEQPPTVVQTAVLSRRTAANLHLRWQVLAQSARETEGDSEKGVFENCGAWSRYCECWQTSPMRQGGELDAGGLAAVEGTRRTKPQ